MEELGRKSVEDFKLADKKPLVVVMDNIRSMHNVGSVFRTADAFLIKGICLGGFTPQPPHRDIHKTALGSTETVDWEGYENPAEAIAHLKKKGYKIFAIEQAHNSILLNELNISVDEKIALIFGNEADGVSEELIGMADACVEIPQAGSKHSFNISVAAGIVLWHLFNKIKL